MALSALLAAACCGVLAAPARAAAAAATIAVNGSSAGRTFGGVGAISGGGGNSRLLADYPAAQQSQILEQARARNPNIKLYGLAWAAPGWIGGGNFWSADMISYLVSWLNCARSDGLTINYLGGWNERGYSISWYEQLRSTLNADGYSGVQIVGADSDGSIAGDIACNSAFTSAVQIIGTHYPCAGGDGGSADSCTANTTAEGTGQSAVRARAAYRP